jgi:hypothetical protein
MAMAKKSGAKKAAPAKGGKQLPPWLKPKTTAAPKKKTGGSMKKGSC